MLKKYIILSVIFFFVAQSGVAATLEWRPARVTAAPGDRVEVSLWLDAGGEAINALEGELVYPTPVLSSPIISDGDSVINFWLEAPAVVVSGMIRFSGIIPGGWDGVLSPYTQDRGLGKILTLSFLAPAPGEYFLTWRGARALRNDGEATAVSLQTTDLALEINPILSNNALPVVLTDDQTAPEPFTPVIARDHGLFANRWFITFATSDTGSGVAHYEIQEHLAPAPAPDAWHGATSPHVLADQQLRKYVSVRALDYAGNERVSTLAPINIETGYDSRALWLIIIVLCFVTLFYYFYSSRRRS